MPAAPVLWHRGQWPAHRNWPASNPHRPSSTQTAQQHSAVSSFEVYSTSAHRRLRGIRPHRGSGRRQTNLNPSGRSVRVNRSLSPANIGLPHHILHSGRSPPRTSRKQSLVGADQTLCLNGRSWIAAAIQPRQAEIGGTPPLPCLTLSPPRRKIYLRSFSNVPRH